MKGAVSLARFLGAMKTNFAPLISKPCPADWDAMTGDAKRRFCEHCRLHVHNLTAMDEAERVALLFAEPLALSEKEENDVRGQLEDLFEELEDILFALHLRPR